MAALIIVSVPWVIFRVSTLCFNYIRFLNVMSRTGLASEKEIRKSVQFVLSKCFLGDWFVLAQGSKTIKHFVAVAFGALNYGKILLLEARRSRIGKFCIKPKMATTQITD